MPASQDLAIGAEGFRLDRSCKINVEKCLLGLKAGEPDDGLHDGPKSQGFAGMGDVFVPAWRIKSSSPEIMVFQKGT